MQSDDKKGNNPLPPAVLSMVAAGSVIPGMTHLLIRNPIPACRVGALRLANIVVVNIVGLAALILFLRDVDVDRGRARSALSWQLRILSLKLLRHVDLI